VQRLQIRERMSMAATLSWKLSHNELGQGDFDNSCVMQSSELSTESTTEFLRGHSISARAVGLLKDLAEKTTEACRSGFKFLTYDIMDSDAAYVEATQEELFEGNIVSTVSLTDEEQLMATAEMHTFEELWELNVALKRAGYPNLNVRCFRDQNRLVLMGKVFKFYHLQTAIESARKFADGRRIDVQIEVETMKDEQVSQCDGEFEFPVGPSVDSTRN